ncbi:hypothetical protein HNV08_02485 [Winogradskyella eckloniae]|uniref:hypothetical protein n=1 Tax=Winogradskyella eckloniae TaxID=1089306 RepID=UPI001563E530|nr:hypothetical protein [Winogradskyella eckloniae]NRD18902.1 hypothetical protein [Winogradskyella eckloniae]
MKIKTLILLSLIVTYGCKCNKTSTEMVNKKVETTLIAQGNLYGSGSEGIDKQNLVITNENDWTQLLNQMDSVNKVSSGFSESKIDFSKYAVITIFESVKGSGGHKINIAVSTTSETKIVKVMLTAPSGVASSVMTQPYYLAKIAKSNLPIVFENMN